MLRFDVQIQLDPTKLVEDVIREAEQALEDLMMAAYHQWQDEAARAVTSGHSQYSRNTGNKLTTTLRAFQNAIQYRKVEPGRVELFMQETGDKDNMVALMIEGGYQAFNIWPSVLSGRGEQRFGSKGRAGMYATKSGKFKGAVPTTPYVDIPFWTGGKKETSSPPDYFRRMSRNNIQGKWIHPGFRPIGKGGLVTPTREKVVEYVQKTARDVFGARLATVIA